MLRTRFAFFIGCLVAGLICAVSSHGAAAGDGLTAAQAPQESPTNISRPYYRVPTPIPQEELPAYARILQLSEAQQSFLAELHERYWQETVTAMDSRKRVLAETSVAAGFADQGPVKTPAYAELFSRLVDAEVSAQRDAESRDDQLFSQLESVLTADQRENVIRVRMRRQRERIDPLAINTPGARIDLTLLIEKTGLSADELAGIDQLTREYEAAVSPLFVALARENFDAARKEVQAEVKMNFADDGTQLSPDGPEAWVRGEVFLRRLSEIRGELGRLERSIRTLNGQYAAKFKEALPPSAGAELDRLFREKAYPLVYPDLQDPAGLNAALAVDPQLDKVELESIAVSWSEFLAAYQSLNRSMCRQCDDYVDRLTGTGIDEDATQYLTTMRELRMQRYDLIQKYLRSVGAICTEARSLAMHRKIEAFNQQVDLAMKHLVIDPSRRVNG